jgi:hypothetical protein
MRVAPLSVPQCFLLFILHYLSTVLATYSGRSAPFVYLLTVKLLVIESKLLDRTQRVRHHT